MTSFLTFAFVSDLLSITLFCVGSSYLVRANIFGILIDCGRIFIPAVIFVLSSFFASGDLGLGSVLLASSITCILWYVIMFGFLWMREKRADDILLSLGLQTLLIGAIAFLLNRTVNSQHMESPFLTANLEKTLPIIAIVFAFISITCIIASIYVLKFSSFRISLAHAHAYRGYSGTYPKGVKQYRSWAFYAASFCFFLGSILPVLVSDPSVHTWKDGWGILIFGIVYALRGKILVCIFAGLTIAVFKELAIMWSVGTDNRNFQVFFGILPLLVGVYWIVHPFLIKRLIVHPFVIKLLKALRHDVQNRQEILNIPDTLPK